MTRQLNSSLLNHLLANKFQTFLGRDVTQDPTCDFCDLSLSVFEAEEDVGSKESALKELKTSFEGKGFDFNNKKTHRMASGCLSHLMTTCQSPKETLQLTSVFFFRRKS